MLTAQSNRDIVFVDEENTKHLEQIAQHLTDATGKTHLSEHLLPAQTLHPLAEETQADIADYPDEEKDQGSESKLKIILPMLQKTSGSSSAVMFLKKKMEWMSKKHGGEVILK